MRRSVLVTMRRRLLVLLALVVGLTTLIAWERGGSDFFGRLGEPKQPFLSQAQGLRVGLVAGHWGSDSGAVCSDGLTEQGVNLRIAEETARRLRQAGLEVVLLEEFDPQLQGYRADAFVSIHSDSCEVQLSGFKVARVSQSAVPEAEDRLVQCLWDHYEQATNLPRHEETITYDMQEYHAFWEIAPQTPGAIIEVGFLGGDRSLLEKRYYIVGRGIADGILCFLLDDEPAE